ncbi:MAG TPA: TRAP transporter substrate-binding protein DctP [Vicinamibacteria bacterium]|nr:TRAP transporter substrate-binding protein DctP [Vicinamibacteria bacterium]
MDPSTSWRHHIRRSVTAWMAVLALAPAAPAAAQPVLVKMATLVPDGSSWHLILKQTADRWKTLSNGRVNVRLYAGGVAGDDPDVVRKMRLGTLNAGVLTSVGMAEVDESVYALGVPMMYESYDELYYVLEKMRPRLEASLESKGFVVLNWADGGWVHFFTQKPVATPDDLRAQKLFVWAGDATTVDLWKSAGFNPIPLPATEIATALQTGLVNALGCPPQVAVISQYYTHAKNMTALPWQLLLGATIINKGVWERIPADVRPALRQAALEAGARLQQEIRQSGDRDVQAMRKRGLNVVTVDAATRELWRKTAESLYPRIRGSVVPADAFDEAMRHRDEYRKSRGTR